MKGLQVRQRRNALFSGSSDQFGAPAFGTGGGGGRAVKKHVDPSGIQILVGLRRAGIGNVGNIDTSHPLQKLDIQMPRGTDAVGRDIQFARVALGVVDHLAHCRKRRVLSCHEHGAA